MSSTYNATFQEGVGLLHRWRVLGRVPIAKSHGLGIVAVGVDTTHNTLIITEEEDGKTGHSIDGNQQGALLQPPGHIELGNAVHDGRR